MNAGILLLLGVQATDTTPKYKISDRVKRVVDR